MNKFFKGFLSTLLLLAQTVLFAQQDTLPAPTSYRVNGVTFKMVRVEKGDYWMGAQHMDTAEFNYDRYSQTDELPVHYVTIKADYCIGQTEVTQKLWKAVMGYNPSKKKCDKLPVTDVNYYEVQEFLRRLDSITGMQFRLPTEEEWEYAARGGKNSRGYVYSGGNDVDRVAWHNGNTGKLKKPKKRTANELYGNGAAPDTAISTRNATRSWARRVRCTASVAGPGSCPRPRAVCRGEANACPT